MNCGRGLHWGKVVCAQWGRVCVYMCVCACIVEGGGALQNGVHHGRMCVCTVGRDVHCALLWTSRWKEEGRKNCVVFVQWHLV